MRENHTGKKGTDINIPMFYPVTKWNTKYISGTERGIPVYRRAISGEVPRGCGN